MPEWVVSQVAMDAPEARSVFADLLDEYNGRYPERYREQLTGVEAEEVAPPDGAFLVVTEDGVTVAGGAFRRYDTETAELKRIWTAKAHRRRGLGRLIVRELEDEARLRGYRRIYLTTGPRQPEAKALYLAAGYAPQFDLGADPEVVRHLGFVKALDS